MFKHHEIHPKNCVTNGIVNLTSRRYFVLFLVHSNNCYRKVCAYDHTSCLKLPLIWMKQDNRKIIWPRRVYKHVI